MSIVSDNTIARLNDISDALTTKDSFLLTFTGNKSIFTVNFNMKQLYKHLQHLIIN